MVKVPDIRLLKFIIHALLLLKKNKDWSVQLLYTFNLVTR